MKKRILALLMALAMTTALVACSSDDEVAADDDTDADVSVGVTTETLKLGLVLIGDEASAYDANHIEGMSAALEATGISEDQMVVKANIGENADCETAILELIEAGCHMIFTNSFGHEAYLVKVAADYPEVEFFAATGYVGASDDLDNTHNFFAEIHEARYLAGIAAGLQTETNKLGYVAAKPYAEVISGFTAFYLGAKSVNPDVEMYVNYTNEWSDAAKEAINAQALIDLGCDVISQHSDTSAPATTAQAAGVYAVGYNADMISAAPEAALLSARINWGVFYEYAITTMLAGEELVQDWCQGYEEGAVYLSPLNEDIAVDGIAEAIEVAAEGIIDGSIQVFQGPLNNIDGTVAVEDGEYFIENEFSSAPSWDYVIEGINVLS